MYIVFEHKYYKYINAGCKKLFFALPLKKKIQNKKETEEMMTNSNKLKFIQPYRVTWCKLQNVANITVFFTNNYYS